MLYVRKLIFALLPLLGVALLTACAAPVGVTDAESTTPAAEVAENSLTANVVAVEDAAARIQDNAVTALQFAPGGDAIYSGHADGAVVQRNAQGEAVALLDGHDAVVTELALGPAGARIASIGQDNSTILQSTNGSNSWESATELTMANSIDFRPDGEALAEAYWEKLLIWPLEDPSAGATQIEGLEPSIRLARYSPDGTTIAVSFANTGLAQPAILFLNAQDGSNLGNVTPTAMVTMLRFSPDGSRFATVTEEGVQVWGINDDAPSISLALTEVRALAFNADGSMLYSAAQPTQALEITQWNLADGEIAGSSTLDVMGNVAAAFAPDLTNVAVGYPDGSVKLSALE